MQTSRFIPKKILFGLVTIPSYTCINWNKIENNELFAKPKFQLLNRTHTREAQKDVNDCRDKLFWIESYFITELFSPEMKWSYKESFEHFNAAFYNTAKTLKYKWIEIDKMYFFNKYKPID